MKQLFLLIFFFSLLSSPVATVEAQQHESSFFELGPKPKKTVKVKSYTKKNGTHVSAHTRSAPTKKKK